MRKVQVSPPSFPAVRANEPLAPGPAAVWRVLCGDAGHWRLGLYSPQATHAGDCAELEQHDCPELFLLLSGKLTLVLAEEGRLVELPLEQGKPVLVTAAHSGFCPEGPHTGRAVVVERDAFVTEYRPSEDWLSV